MAKLQYRTISKRTVDGLSVAEKDAVFWDRELPGFGVRVYPSGSKVYVVQCRTNGKSRRVTLGRHGIISADQAGRKATLTIARIKGGEAPESTSPGTVTVAALAERYLKEYVAVHCKPSSAKLYAERSTSSSCQPTAVWRSGRSSESTFRRRITA